MANVLQRIFNRGAQAEQPATGQAASGESPWGGAGPATDAQQGGRLKRAWNYYYGSFPKPLVSSPREPDLNICVNWCRTGVNKGVSFLFGEDVTFDVMLSTPADAGAEDVDDSRPETFGVEDDGAAARRDPADEWLEGCWEENRQMTLLQKWALNGAMAGQAFLKIVPRGPGKFPRIVVLDPSMMAVDWKPDDISEVLSYTIQWAEMRNGQQVKVRQVIERNVADTEEEETWTLLDQVQPPGSEAWILERETLWPYPFAPIVDCQNQPAPNDYWGLPDLTPDLLDLNDQANRGLSNMNRILYHYAHPKTYGRGIVMRPGGLDWSPGNIPMVGEKGELVNLEMQGDLASSVELYKRAKEGWHEMARVPEVATGAVDHMGTLSGLALQILYQPLLELTHTKRRSYGDALCELNRRLMIIGGWPGRKTVIHWPALLPQDDRETSRAAKEWVGVGASRGSVLERFGNFDAALELKRRRQEMLEDQAAGVLPPAAVVHGIPTTIGAEDAGLAGDTGTQPPVAGVGAAE